ncbi:hypothetical protein RND71_006078 [Anisodus tanguticus]|uniref:Uncharacterized protein n=1 Tax=Anisodus tanguticus TaxID=243964 RepID=A0AAE1VSX5_9SOLA|nr:hypothetical protein RND71_006078 [Anisodus tanguticus]
MGDGKIKMSQDQWFQCGNNLENKDHSLWMINGGINSLSSSSIGESTISSVSCSSSLEEIMDDASSPASCISSSFDGALGDLSTLMAQLPIKRGLSEYYEGKSETFTCLARVTSVEDLPKNETRKMKVYKSSYKSYTLPKPIILKKASRSSLLSSSYTARKSNSSISRSRPPLIPVQRT